MCITKSLKKFKVRRCEHKRSYDNNNSNSNQGKHINSEVIAGEALKIELTN